MMPYVLPQVLTSSSDPSLQKTDKKNPKWFMVDVTFRARTAHFIPLALLRRIAAAPASAPPDDVAYIKEAGAKAIQRTSHPSRVAFPRIY